MGVKDKYHNIQRNSGIDLNLSQSEEFVVLEISGKRDEVDTVKINIFYDREEAEEYCLEVTDNIREKYWRYARIINKNEEYEFDKYSIIKF